MKLPSKVVEYVVLSTARVTGASYEEDPFNSGYCIDSTEPDDLSVSDVTDIYDVNTCPGDVIDDADLSSLRESLTCDLFRYNIQKQLSGWSNKRNRYSFVRPIRASNIDGFKKNMLVYSALKLYYTLHVSQKNAHFVLHHNVA